MIGWVAVTGTLSIEPILLFAIIYVDTAAFLGIGIGQK